jgi:aryl-alcohol dehydrogenase-like predicted oxidoreductase
LQVDYLDLYFCHRPDIHTPIEETVWTMNDLMRQGKILYWGTSEWNAQQITEAHLFARQNHLVGPTMEQPEYNLFHREKVEKEFAPLYKEFGLGTTIWSPLASGVLTGKYSAGIPKDSRLEVPGYEWLKNRYLSEDGKQRIDKARQFSEFARELGCSASQLAIAWCLKNKNVSTVILGASKETQLEENLKAQDCVKILSDEVIQRIEKIFQNKPSEISDFR